MRRKLLFISASILFSHCPLVNILAATRGYVSTNESISDSASVCLSVGLTASITNLNDFNLTTNNISGGSGSRFSGTDQFNLESNGQISVIIEHTPLKQGNHEIPLFFNIDNSPTQFSTELNNSHSGEHNLNAEAILGNIASQSAGQYSAEVTLTVSPTVGGESGCGAQTYSYPSMTRWGTMAWEDLYPNPGDADYNDFVVNFRIEEQYNPSSELESIHLEFLPVARGAEYNHSLNLSFDGVIDATNNAYAETTPVFTGDAQIVATYNNLDSGSAHTKYFNSGEDIVVFSNTRSAAGGGFVNVYPEQNVESPRWLTQIDVNLTHNQSVGTGGLISGEFNYRAYLSVNNTQKDIDLFQVNAENGMIDSNGYPFGLVLPEDWYWPNEQISVNEVYPLFSEYRSWLSGENPNISTSALEWYNHPYELFEENTTHVDVNDFNLD